MSTLQKAAVLLAAAYAITTLLSRAAPQAPLSSPSLLNVIGFWILSLLGWGTYSIVIFPRYLSPLKSLPTAPGGNLVLGQFLPIFKAPSGELQQRWAHELPNEGLIRYLYLFNIERVVPTTPKALAEILVTRNYEFVKPAQMREGLARLLGVGILLAEGDEHKRQRRLMNPAFAFRHVKDLYSIFWSKGRESVDAITAEFAKPPASGKEPGVVEIGEWASRTTLDIIGLAGMGQDFHAIANPNNELNRTYRNIFAPNKAAQLLGLAALFIPRPLLRALPLKRSRDVNEARVKIRDVCQDLIKSKREQQSKSSRTDIDVLSVMLESGGFSDEDIINQLMTFLAAGHETTASALIWAVHLLCTHPEVQQRLRDEIRQNLPSIADRNSTITSTEIDRLPYLSAVCNETLRIRPPVSLTLRTTASTTTVVGHVIPKGTQILLVPQVVNLDKTLWGEDADQFNPERWLAAGKANTGGAVSNYAFLTFLHGPRSCIGQSFAKAEFACVLATWVGRWRMELADPDMKIDVAGGISVKPKGGLPVRLTSVDGW